MKKCRSLFFKFSAAIDNLEARKTEMHYYTDSLTGLLDDEANFRKEYRKVFEFKLANRFKDGDAEGYYFDRLVETALRAAALRAGTKAAELPLALIDAYLAAASEFTRNNFFSALAMQKAILCMNFISGLCLVELQQLMYFVHYSSVMKLCPQDIRKKLEAPPEYTTNLYAGCVVDINKFKWTFFLKQDELMLPVIADPKSFCNTKYWDYDDEHYSSLSQEELDDELGQDIYDRCERI